MEMTEVVKELLVTTAKALKGSARRMFVARTVQALGEGGQRLAKRELGGIVGPFAKECCSVTCPGASRQCLFIQL